MADDRSLIEAWSKGDRAAGDELFERHFDAVRRFFVNKVSEGIEDLIQKTFLACLESPERLAGVRDVRAFILGIARHKLFAYYRAKQRVGERFDALQTSVHDINPSPSVILARGERGRELLDALRRIPLDLQIALELHYWENLSSTEMAAVLEVAPGTVKSRLRRAKEMLEGHLGNRFRRALEEGPDTLESWARELREQIDRE